jgi:hypothetical protein
MTNNVNQLDVGPHSPTPAHTPGPWTLWLSRDARTHQIAGPARFRVEGAQTATIAEVHHYGSRASGYAEEQTANARLMAAAPELAEALQAMVEEKADYMVRNNLGDPSQQHTIRVARAALDKARGQS